MPVSVLLVVIHLVKLHSPCSIITLLDVIWIPVYVNVKVLVQLQYALEELFSLFHGLFRGLNVIFDLYVSLRLVALFVCIKRVDDLRLFEYG